MKSSRKTYKVKAIDLIVNTEGRKSSTNVLVGITRIPVLSKISAIAAIFREKNASYTTIHQNFYVNDEIITAGTFIKTPEQIYLGFGLAQKENEYLLEFQEKIKNAKNVSSFME